MSRTRHSGFVGRERELTLASFAVSEAYDGRGQLFSISGEPGIGKTSLAHELARIAADSGFSVFWGRCDIEASAQPYWPWFTVIREIVSSYPGETLPEALGSKWATIENVLADSESSLPPANHTSDPQNAESSRLRLFDAVVALLEIASASTPICLILDDLHWSDASSLRMLEYVSRHVSGFQIVIAMTHRATETRSNPALSATIAEFSRQPGHTGVELTGLSRDSITELIRVGQSLKLSESTIGAVFDRTDGHPLFASEIARFLAESDTEGNSGGVRIDLPLSVRAILDQRFSELHDSTVAILRSAALLGRTFTIRHLIAVKPELSLDELVIRLAEATAARLIFVMENPDIYEFSHAIVSDALVDGLQPAERQKHHADIATSLEAMYGDTALNHAGELVLHFREGVSMLPASRYAEFAAAAGEAALGRHAYEQAFSVYNDALELVGNSISERLVADLEYGLAQAQLVILPRSDTQQSVDLLHASFSKYLALGEIAIAARVLSVPVVPVGGTTNVVDFIDSSLARLGDVSFDYPIIQTRLAQALQVERNDLIRALTVLNDARRNAQKQGDNAALVHIDHAELTIEAQQSRTPSVVLRANELIKTSAAVGDHIVGTRAQFYLTLGHLAEGNLSGATTAAVTYLNRAQTSGDQVNIEQAHIFGSLIQMCKGNWTNVSDHVAQLRSNDARARVAELVANGFLPRGEHGAPGVVESNTAGRSRPDSEFFVNPVIADYIRDRRSLESDVADSQSILDSPATPPVRRIAAATSMAISFCLGQQVERAIKVRPIIEQGPTIMTLNACVSRDRVLAKIASLEGNDNAARTAYSTAIDTTASAGFLVEEAFSSIEYAEHLIDHDAREDVALVRGLLTRADQIARDLPLLPLQARTHRLADRLENIPPMEVSNPAGLSNREIEVLRLLATGLSNPEIATQLFITRNTVRRHVSNIFAKTGATNRVEAATAARVLFD
ncbi:MAG: AAA family ATPase [Chloroflexi bacterium]|nr:AAA family ATPase [Chloroflexota bacterium]